MFGKKVTKKEFVETINEFMKTTDRLSKEIRDVTHMRDLQPKVTNVASRSMPSFNMDKILAELFSIKFPSKYEKGKEYNQVFIMQMDLKMSITAREDVKEDTYLRYFHVFDKKRNQLKNDISEADLTILIESNK